MGDRLEAQNAFDIDDSGTMDANKTDGIEPFGKLIQRGKADLEDQSANVIFKLGLVE